MDPKGRLCGKHKSTDLIPCLPFGPVIGIAYFCLNYHTFVLPLTQHYIVGNQLFLAFSQIRIGTTTYPFSLLPLLCFIKLYHVYIHIYMHCIFLYTLCKTKPFTFGFLVAHFGFSLPTFFILHHKCTASWSLYHFSFSLIPSCFEI